MRTSKGSALEKVLSDVYYDGALSGGITTLETVVEKLRDKDLSGKDTLQVIQAMIVELKTQQVKILDERERYA